MAEVKFNFTARDLFRTITELSPAALTEVAEMIINDIRLQAQGRKLGINSDGKTQRLPDLALNYREQRKNYYKPRGRLSDKTGANQKRSNVTLTGDLMSGLTYTVRPDRGEIQIFFGGQHQTAKMSRDELYTILLEKNERYEVLNVRDKLFVQIRNKITREIARKLRNFN